METSHDPAWLNKLHCEKKIIISWWFDNWHMWNWLYHITFSGYKKCFLILSSLALILYTIKTLLVSDGKWLYVNHIWYIMIIHFYCFVIYHFNAGLRAVLLFGLFLFLRWKISFIILDLNRFEIFKIVLTVCILINFHWIYFSESNVLDLAARYSGSFILYSYVLFIFYSSWLFSIITWIWS